MKFKTYSIYDSVGKTYLKPFNVKMEGEAIRAFKNASNDKQSEIGRNPQDYCLYLLATWNDETGEVKPVDPPINLGLATKFQDT
jgi:hypothetical protein